MKELSSDVFEMKIFLVSIIAASLISCTNTAGADGQEKLLSSDYRIFQGTAAWELAKAVHEDNGDKVKNIIIKNRHLTDAVDPHYGQTLLGLAVYERKYASVKALVELGADPNAFNNYDGRTPLMEAADIGYHDIDLDPRYLTLLLKFGANPNLEQKYIDYSGSHGQTALLIACAQGSLAYVKILVNAGASVKGKNGMKILSATMLSENPELLMYLIDVGIDYKQPTTITDLHKRFYVTDDLRYWRFDLGSVKYEKKMEIVAFLKAHGMDYRQTKIPDFYYKSYSKEYLEKY